MKKLTLSVAAIVAIVGFVLWKRNRQSMHEAWDDAVGTASSWGDTAAREASRTAGTAAEIGHDLADAARQAVKTADEVQDELKNAAQEAGKAADSASKAADEFKAAVERAPEGTE